MKETRSRFGSQRFPRLFIAIVHSIYQHLTSQKKTLCLVPSKLRPWEPEMAPSKSAAATAPFSKDERVLCFHHDMLYEAKVLDSRATEDNQSWQYRIHYKGWKNTVSPVPLVWHYLQVPSTACERSLVTASSKARSPRFPSPSVGCTTRPESKCCDPWHRDAVLEYGGSSTQDC